MANDTITRLHHLHGWIYIFFGQYFGDLLIIKFIGVLLSIFAFLYGIVIAFSQENPFMRLVYVLLIVVAIIWGGIGFINQLTSECNEVDKLCDSGYFCGIDYTCKKAPDLEITYKKTLIKKELYYTHASIVLALSFIISAFIVRRNPSAKTK